MKALPVQSHPDLIVGFSTSDDAGVVRLTPEIALIQTVDFFTPMVNDPHAFGRIAAVNALSDVYAMGGRPYTAMNLVCFPKKGMDIGILKEILSGGFEAISEAEAMLVGGHSVDDPEIKYGLSLTGLVHPNCIIANNGAKPGDMLVLTKPIGTGILATALKARLLPKEAESEAIFWMGTLNKKAAEAMQAAGASACTDITGFGLLGHALEMAIASKVTMEIWASKVPLLSHVMDMINMGMLPEGSGLNRQFCSKSVEIDQRVDAMLADCLADAQTSGGLLISIPEERLDPLLNELKTREVFHAIIGRVLGPSDGRIVVTP